MWYLAGKAKILASQHFANTHRQVTNKASASPAVGRRRFKWREVPVSLRGAADTERG